MMEACAGALNRRRT